MLKAGIQKSKYFKHENYSASMILNIPALEIVKKHDIAPGTPLELRLAEGSLFVSGTFQNDPDGYEARTPVEKLHRQPNVIGFFVGADEEKRRIYISSSYDTLHNKGYNKIFVEEDAIVQIKKDGLLIS
jgi:hypothetical protein